MSRVTEVLFAKKKWVHELNANSGKTERVAQTSSRFFTTALFVELAELFIGREGAIKVIQDAVDARHSRRNMFSARNTAR